MDTSRVYRGISMEARKKTFKSNVPMLDLEASSLIGGNDSNYHLPDFCPLGYSVLWSRQHP